MSSYYRPYTSDSDSDSDSDSYTESELSETDSDSVSGDISGPNFRSFAEGLSLMNAAGPSMDLSGEILYSKHPLGYPLVADTTSFTNYTITPDASGSLKSNTQSVNGIIMLDSRDRDRSVFPQPTYLTLRLPRTYTNITSFQIVQIKLLSSFFYFRADKFNTDISILESGRTSGDIPTVVKSYIREGTYDINSLLTEITTQLNMTPVFYDFPNGFQEFAIRFASTGDFGVNFNYPGDTYYDSLAKVYIPNPTMETIISRYFQTQYAGLSSYTTNQLKVAYYYPVLKEALLDTPGVINLSVDVPLLPGETVYTRCIYTFEGIDDAVILAVININLQVLDTYRLDHTFRYSLINQYTVSVQPQSNRITIASSSLNRSLVSLLQAKQAQYLSEALTANGLTPAQYTALQTQNTLLLAVLNDMFYYLQKYLAVYFGVPFNTYDISYLANPNFVVPLRDATDATGISSNYDAQVIARGTPPITTNILSQFQQNPLRLWPGYSNTRNIVLPINLETGNPITSSNYPYDLARDEQDRSRNFIDNSSGIIYTNALTRYSDIVVPLNGAEYTVFRFTSPVRQTLQIETLPRPTKYRYLAYNAANYDAAQRAIFDNSYSYVNTNQTALNWILTNTSPPTPIQPIPRFATAPFGISYTSSLALWGASTVVSYVGRTVNAFSFTAPRPTNFQPPACRYPFSVTIAAERNFNTLMYMFVYHDRGGLMADLALNGNENSYNYKTVVSTTTAVSSVTANFDVYSGQIYYVLARAEEDISPTQYFRIVPWCPTSTFTTLASTLVGFDPLADPTTPAALSNFNYAQVTDPAWIRLPTSSNLIPPTSVDPLSTTLNFSTTAIGYDVNGVSTDLTDYFAYNAGETPIESSPTRIDPVNQYIFQAASPYNTSTQSYFYSTSVNTILTPDGGALYNPSTVVNRLTSIVNTTFNTYLPNSLNQAPVVAGQTVSRTISSFTSGTTQTPMNGYTYAVDSTIQLGDGVAGISFVPTQGVWDIQRFMFASAYITTDPAIDTNRNIAYIGIFYTSQMTFFNTISLTSSIAVLGSPRATTYDGVNLSFGYGSDGGTYYEFTRDTSFNTGSNAYFYGYAQVRRQFNPDSNAMYTAIPFDANRNIVSYQCLIGSPVPYHDINVKPVRISTAYFDGNRTPNGADLIIPTSVSPPFPFGKGYPPGYDETQIKYEQSMPIGTNVLHYISPYPFLTQTDAMTLWPSPNTFVNPVFDMSGFVLTGDSVFHVYSYQTNTTVKTFQEVFQITLDEIIPDPNAVYLGVAGSERAVAFAFWIQATNKLLFQIFDPTTGRVSTSDAYSSPFDFTQVQITNMTYNNIGGFTMAVRSPTEITAYAMTPAGPITVAIPITFSRCITRQSPKNIDGQFYVFLMDGADTVDSYMYIDPKNQTGTSTPLYVVTWPTIPRGTATLYTPSLTNLTNPIICRQPFADQLLFLRAGSRAVYQQTGSRVVGGSNIADIGESVFRFPVVPTALYQGANGGRWANAGALYGNRNDKVDAPRSFSAAWQIFYPVQRIVFTHIANNFTFMRNRKYLEYPEYPHTAVTIYDSYQKFVSDIGPISTISRGKWGLESSSNFLVADYKFAGEIFNGSIFSAPLQPSTVYYVALRNYSPTEKSQVLLRCGISNKYDYGYVSLTDVGKEVSTLATSSNLFTPDYYQSLSGFNSNFVLSSITFGENIIQGFNGSNFSSITGFADFYRQFTDIYATYNSQVQLVQNINSTVTSNINTFIQADLRNIIPANASTRQRYTDPLTFSILWKSALTPGYAAKEDNWGLGWNLGYAKADTPYSTVQISPTFYKILDDYINLRLNPEFDMNRVDSGYKENLAASQETTGSTKAFHAKLLLANFGSYAQTLISNPVSFMPPLGKMDKITFQWLDPTETQINNDDCEWNVVVQIVEKKEIVEIPKVPLVSMRLH